MSPRTTRARRPWIPRAKAVAALGLAACVALSPAAARAADAPVRAMPAVGLEAVAATTTVDVVVRGSDPAAAVRARGGTVTRDLHLIGGVGARLAAGDARALAADPRVSAVVLNAPVETTGRTTATDTAFLESTRTDVLRESTGATGKGVAIAVIDTGIAGGLVDFADAQGDSRVRAAVATNPDATTEEDTVGHGTHVAGLAAGDGSRRPAGDPLTGAYGGTAPDADLVSIKVSDDDGATSLIDVIFGLQFAVDHREELGIRVVNLSLTATDDLPAAEHPLNAAVQAAWNSGLVVVVAAGNRGAAPGAVDFAPANDPFAIAVGAVDDQGTKRTADDTLATWSSRGTTREGVAKPDVLAPGSRLVAPLAPNARFAELCPSCVVDGAYLRLGGTSMAAPVVAGIVAALLEVRPELTPDQVKGALTTTLRRTADGRGQEVDAQRAARAEGKKLRANGDATPSALIDPVTGDIDWARASWTRASWTRASWTRASWTRASWTCVCSPLDAADVDPTRASWTRASWTRASWTRASWTVSFDK